MTSGINVPLVEAQASIAAAYLAGWGVVRELIERLAFWLYGV